MSHYQTLHIDVTANRTELHDALALTANEVSLNNLPAGISIPFVHAHTHNEELYIVLEGNGVFFVDGDAFGISQGDCIRVEPKAQRCLRAAQNSTLRYLCIQAKAGSLEGFRAADAVISEDFIKASWLK